jgi:hypothetical protein
VDIWTSLEPPSAVVDPGGEVTIVLRLRNTGDIVEEYRVAVAGDPAGWARVEPAAPRLYPGTTANIEITFAPPRTPDAAAGAHPFGIEVVPTERPELRTVVEGNLTVTPFADVRAELLPPLVRGRFRGRPRFAVDNYGNTRITASLVDKNDGQLTLDLDPSTVQIAPGRAAWGKGRIKPSRIIWIGQKQSHPYKLSVQLHGAEPLLITGTYLQPSIMPRWVSRLLMVLVMLAVLFAALWYAFKPGVSSHAKADGALNGQGRPISIPTAPAAGGGGATPGGGGSSSGSQASAPPRHGSRPHESGRPLGGPGYGLYYLSSSGPSAGQPTDQLGATAQSKTIPVRSPGLPQLGQQPGCQDSAVTFTLCNATLTYKPGTVPTFDFWVRSNGDPDACISVAFFWNFDGQRVERVDAYSSFQLKATTGWQKYTELAGEASTQGSGFQNFKGGNLTIGFWVTNGTSPIEVRDNVPVGQEEVSALRVPYF